jgi:hypothetical protein
MTDHEDELERILTSLPQYKEVELTTDENMAYWPELQKAKAALEAWRDKHVRNELMDLYKDHYRLIDSQAELLKYINDRLKELEQTT